MAIIKLSIPRALATVAAAGLLGCTASGGDPTPDPGGGEADASVAGDPADASAPGLPLIVDDYYAASGYMGDGEQPGAITDDQCQGMRGGDGRGLCHKFTWAPAGANWAGVFWQFPEGNWGTEPGLAVPSGASRVSFYAWGAQGGEQIGFMVGMSDVDGFEVKEENITLTSEPTRYTLSLDSTGYSEVVGGFGWVGAESPSAVVFFVDDIVWE